MKATELTGEQLKFEQGDRVTVRLADGKTYAAEFVGQSESGIGWLEEKTDFYRFTPWAGLIYIQKTVA